MPRTKGPPKKLGRPQIVGEYFNARFARGTMARIEAVRTAKESIAGFVRLAVETELDKREEMHGISDRLAQAIREAREAGVALVIAPPAVPGAPINFQAERMPGDSDEDYRARVEYTQKLNDMLNKGGSK